MLSESSTKNKIPHHGKVFSYNDHKIKPQTEYWAKNYEQAEWNKAFESNDIPDRTHKEKMHDDESSQVQTHTKLSNYQDMTRQLQTARINYLKNMMVRTSVPSFDRFAEKNFNGEQQDNNWIDKQYDLDSSPPTLPAYNMAQHKPMNPQRSYEIAEKLGISGNRNLMNTGMQAMGNLIEYLDEEEIIPRPETEQQQPVRNSFQRASTSMTDRTNRIQEPNKIFHPVSESQTRHDDFPEVTDNDEYFMVGSNQNLPAVGSNKNLPSEYGVSEPLNWVLSSDRFERQSEYSPPRSNPLTIFGGFQGSELLNLVGKGANRVPKSISNLNNLNGPLFYPEKHITPPGHESVPLERALKPTHSPYAPKFEYQVTPVYKPTPLPYAVAGGHTTISPYNSYSAHSPTPIPYSSYSSAEYSRSPTPTFSPTPYIFHESITTISPYYAKTTPYSEKLVDGNIDLVEDRVASSGHGGHVPYTPSYSNSFGLNKNYGRNKPHHGPAGPHHAPGPQHVQGSHHAPGPHHVQGPHHALRPHHAPALHHSPPIKSIHPLKPTPHGPIHVPVYAVQPLSLPHVVGSHGLPPLAAKPHAPLHAGGQIHPGNNT